MISPTSTESTASLYMKQLGWKIIDTMFRDNERLLVDHHLDSYNYFMNHSISTIFIENNPIRFVSRMDSTKNDDDIDNNVDSCFFFLGGKQGDKIYYGKPTIYHEASIADSEPEPYSSFLFPNDARLNNMTYGITIHYDVDVEMSYLSETGERVIHTETLHNIYLGRFPIMVQSSMCILSAMDKHVRFNVGECRNDVGGYFIINGKEKVIVSQERFAPNQLKIKTSKQLPDGTYNDLYTHSARIYSVSEDSSKPTRTTSVGIIAPTAKYKGGQIVVDIPNIKKPVPLFIVMRAFGVISDKSIIETCLLDRLQMTDNSNLVRLFMPSIYDAAFCDTQINALEFMAQLTKYGTISYVMEILSDYLLPHLGEDNFVEKAYYVGYMVHQLLKVKIGETQDTDPDSFKNKRIELSGDLMYSLFREYYLIYKKTITQTIDKEYYYHTGEYSNAAGGNFVNLINSKNIILYFKNRVVEEGVNKGMSGSWGSQPNTKREGIVQDLNRLSWCTASSHLRKINLHMDVGSKLVAPRLLNSTQYGYIDVLDSPDGGNTGLHKHLAISCYVTRGSPKQPIIRWLEKYTDILKLTECSLEQLRMYTKLFINSDWIGVTPSPLELKHVFLISRRNGIIPTFASISFNYSQNEIHIFTDAGRLSRPIFHLPHKINRDDYMAQLTKIVNAYDSNLTWNQYICGRLDKPPLFQFKDNKTYDQLTDFGASNATFTPSTDALFVKNGAILDYMDISEETSAKIALTIDDLTAGHYCTHLEIDPSFILGVMGNSIIYPNHNQLPRNVFSCGQSRQAVSLYHTNYDVRMDKMGVVLNYGQCPLIKSAYLKYVNNEENVYGVNAVVAIMCYSGYNVEDATLFNRASIERGMFNTSYFTSYTASEESPDVSNVSSIIMNTSTPNIVHKSQGYDYDKLDERGIIRENTIITDNTVMIGQATISKNADNSVEYSDKSTKSKRGQLGRVDKTFLTTNKEGFNIAKVRVVELRYPAIGDKFASRAGQKGTVGLIIDEQDMPFTADGIRPDLIINPHALPSRMTISQLIETLFGKVCAHVGGCGDATPFRTIGSNFDTYAPHLNNLGFHSAGTELMHNGATGEQLEAAIFIGPTYYMRLKHMVKDKINYRAKGKNEELTRQPVQGRANDGGLRLGEMERDGILGHGLSAFLNDAFINRADEYFMAVCNKSGTIAVYNKNKNLFLSPHIDGPIQFVANVDKTLNVKYVTQFGRSFSIIRVPYCLKLLMHELECMNVSMKLITDESDIDYFTPTQYSSNITKVMVSTENIETTIRNVQSIINAKLTHPVAPPIVYAAADAKQQIDVPVADKKPYVSQYNLPQPQIVYEEAKKPAADKKPYVIPQPQIVYEEAKQQPQKADVNAPVNAQWEKRFSQRMQAPYWVNLVTGETSWNPPPQAIMPPIRQKTPEIKPIQEMKPIQEVKQQPTTIQEIKQKIKQINKQIIANSEDEKVIGILAQQRADLLNELANHPDNKPVQAQAQDKIMTKPPSIDVLLPSKKAPTMPSVKKRIVVVESSSESSAEPSSASSTTKDDDIIKIDI